MSDSNQFENELEIEKTSSPAMIKSRAIVKFEGPQSGPSKFNQLSYNTDLKNPPDNWLCGRFGDQIWSYPLRKRNSSMFSSFRMVNRFPDCVGQVDVISDSENIKKLLSMPFDDSHISMMVHRIGKTLLIDEFDLANTLFRKDDKQWNWLRKFISDRIIGNYTKNLGKKLITRHDLQSKNFMCRFLHYSVTENDNQENNSQENDSQDNICDMNEQRKNQDNIDMSISPINENKPLFVDENILEKNNLLNTEIDQQLDIIEHKLSGNNSGNLRNVLWTFEDIHMLVSSNMPIFGDVYHPAVSLRLRDMTKPINVLTGLDYWLDNLMCSVPEVVMCYHLDGVVQKYELIPTEDIPQMNNSQFSPKIIRNIAQNILAFLKSKATKSGHTYWLFKGKHDDVVKLYDLTTLCADYMDENESNPFIVPVAMLLYRVAKNLRDSNKERSLPVDRKIHTLLTNCLKLLDPKKHHKIISSAKYILSEVFVPNDIESTELPLPEYKYDDEDDDDEEYFDCGCSTPISDGSTSDDECPSFNIKKLPNPNYIKSKRNKKRQNEEDKDFLPLDWTEKCKTALVHVIDGLKVLVDYKVKDDVKQTQEDVKEEEQPKMANKYEAIPLHFTDKKDKQDDEIKKAVAPTASAKKPLNWKTCLSICLLQKGAQVFCLLSELANNKKFGNLALKYVRMGLLCYECAKLLMEKNGQDACSKEPLSCLLALCGDIHISLLTTKISEEDKQENNEFTIENIINENELLETLENLCEDEILEEYKWSYGATINFDNNIEDRLKLSLRCYEEALAQFNSKYKNFESHPVIGLIERLKRRFGSISNELGLFIMNTALKEFNEMAEQPLTESQVSKLDSLIKKSNGHFDRSLGVFKSIHDKVNIALVLSNTGRLMRTCAHIFAPHNRTNQMNNEFSTKEKHFYTKAASYYQSALDQLTPDDAYPEQIEIYNNITWDLCTTYFTIGYLMQDFAPLSTLAYETVEKLIIDYFTKSLDLCSNGEKIDSKRSPLYQYREAIINHRLASLHHNSYRNSCQPDMKHKQLFILADEYYEKSQTSFYQLNKIEFLRVALERISLHESFLSSLDGFSSKIKELLLIVNIHLKILSIDFIVIEDGDDKAEVEKLLNLEEARIQFCIKGIIKCYSKKINRFKDVSKKWKEIDENITKIQSSEQSIYQRLEKIKDIILSSKLISENES